MPIYYDLWHRLAGEQSDTMHTAIVEVDDESLSLFPTTPLVFWGPHFARAIEVLDKAGAKVIGLDFQLSVSSEDWIARFANDSGQDAHRYDIPLRTQLRKGKTILHGAIGQDARGHERLLLPASDLLHALPNGIADVGLDNILNYSSDVVRQFRPAFSGDRTQPRFEFGVLLALRAIDKDPSSDIQKLENGELGNSAITDMVSSRPIGFVGPAGTIPRLSFASLIDPNALERHEIKALRNKVVIITANFTGTKDIHPTPYTAGRLFKQGECMTGAEIHANIVETLLTGRYPRTPMEPLVALGILGVLSIAIVAYFLLNPGLGLLVGFGLACLWTIGSYLGFLADWRIPVIGTQAGLFVGYLGCMGFRLVEEKRFSCKIKDLFSRYFGSEITNRFLTCGESARLGGERRIVTVLFVDIRNFTAIAARLQPEEVVEMLNTYFGDVSRAIEEEGGRIDKFIGDAVMAVFGDLSDEKDHAWRAVRAARKIEILSMKFREHMAKRFTDYGLSGFSVGIGLDTGPVVIGNIGAEDRMEYTAIGDTVNVAARVQEMCKKLGCVVLATQATVAEIIGDKLIYGRYEKVPVKGHPEVPVFEICGLREGDSVLEDSYESA